MATLLLMKYRKAESVVVSRGILQRILTKIRHCRSVCVLDIRPSATKNRDTCALYDETIAMR